MEHRGWYRRRLPHKDEPHLVQMVTFCLVGALIVQNHRAEARSPLGEHEAQLDLEQGACWLRIPEIADLVSEAICCRDGRDYELYAWVVMPNHVHLLFQQLPGCSLARVMQSLKGWTGSRANRILGRSGHFWLPEYWDRYLRNPERAPVAAGYIEENPVTAGLVEHSWEWQWGSAFQRDKADAD